MTPMELFVQILAEHVGVTVSKKADFLEYWPAIKEQLGTDLPMQAAMKRLTGTRWTEAFRHSSLARRDR
jgi:hypothetical protein